jgi:protoporphyrinogen IX oxidase
MSNWLLHAYPWLKAVHVIAAISWMAALLYLPRLFVYHCTAQPGSEMSETFKVMERRLANAIMTPAMIASFALGGLMLATPGTTAYLPTAGLSLWLKLVLAVTLAGVHLWMLRWRDDFAADRNRRPQRFFRVMNEVPTLLMIGIVLLVIARPL